MRRLELAVLAWLLASPLSAHADSRPTLLAEHEPGAPPVTLELGAGWYTDSEGGSSLHAFPFMLGGALRLNEHVELELDWPFVYFTSSGGGGDGYDTFRTGNPLFAGYYVHPFSRGYARIGFGLGIPLATLDLQPSGTFDSLASALRELLPYAVASGTLGYGDFWLYAPERLSLVVPIQFELDRDGLLLGGELAPAVLIPIDPQFDPDVEVVFQLAPLIGARVGPVSLGTRLQLVWLASADVDDDAQLSLVPFVQGKVGSAGFLYARFVLPLDEPIGVLGDGDALWGLHLGGGGSF
jgi:hypothetical protein